MARKRSDGSFQLALPLGVSGVEKARLRGLRSLVTGEANPYWRCNLKAAFDQGRQEALAAVSTTSRPVYLVA